MAVVRTADGRQIRTRHGLQVRQYTRQLHDAGMLAIVQRARGLERVDLQHVASMFVSYLRSGEVSQRSKLCAARLGLQHYPDEVKNA